MPMLFAVPIRLFTHASIPICGESFPLDLRDRVQMLDRNLTHYIVPRPLTALFLAQPGGSLSE